jgi:glycosyltransferase involved in cell wall biosynthesis
MVVRNGLPHIADAITSVIDQQYGDTELIVIDGVSTDGTLGVIRKFESSISYWVSEPDAGIFDAWNKGIARSSGDLIKLLNADDRLTDSSIARAVDCYGGQSVPGVVASDIVVIDDDGAPLKLLRRSAAHGGMWSVLHPSWYVARAVYDQVGLYSTEYRVASDYEMFLRLQSRDIPFDYVDDPLVEFRTGGASSGMKGVKEGYRILRGYYPLRQSITISGTHCAMKARHAMLRRVLGEQGTYRLRAFVRSVSSRARSDG